jgi:superfamily II DNA helicase RecQ
MSTLSPSSFDHCFQLLASSSMHDTFGYCPFPWQTKVLKRLYHMASAKSPIQCQPTFLCQPTGGGKSMVRDTFALTVGGITINVAPLLALNANQHDKLLQKRLLKQKIMSIHLDTYRIHAQQQCIINKILNAPLAASIVLFASPQSLAIGTVWHTLALRLLDAKRLKLVCIDEIHLFAQFGLWFRSEFLLLKKSLFQHLIIASSPGAPVRTRIPVLAMTATAYKHLLDHLQSLTGLITFEKDNVFWPSASGMVQRSQNIEYTPSPQAFRYLKPRFVSCMRGNVTGENPSQFLVYSNSGRKVESWQKALSELTDHEDLLGDVILIALGRCPVIRNFIEHNCFCDQLF